MYIYIHQIIGRSRPNKLVASVLIKLITFWILGRPLLYAHTRRGRPGVTALIKPTGVYTAAGGWAGTCATDGRI